jgi:hypothetical protein
MRLPEAQPINRIRNSPSSGFARKADRHAKVNV